MNNEEIFCMQSQQPSAHNYSHYNKFAHEGRAIIGTSRLSFTTNSV